MLNVSSAYKTAIMNDAQSFKMLALLYFNKANLYPFATATSTTQLDSNHPASQACNGRIRMNDYACSGSYLNSNLLGQQNGWRSSTVSDASGALSASEVLTITYNEAITSSNFWFVGMDGYYPIDFTVDVYENGAWVNIATVAGNNDYVWSIVTPAAHTITQARLTVTKVAPALGGVWLQEFGAVVTIALEGHDIIDATLLEELSADGVDPLGQVTSNEFDLTLSNDDRWYVPNNASGPFYGMFRPKLKVTPFIGLQVADGSYEMLPWGTFYTAPWRATSDGLEATVTCYDRLYDLISEPVPMLGAAANTTVAGLLRLLFNALGFVENTDYVIDPNIALNIPIGWVYADTIGSYLQLIAQASAVQIYCNRQNKIQVKSIYSSGASVVTWTENDQIVSVDNPQLFLNTYSHVNVRNYSASVLPPDNIATVDGISLAAGAQSTQDIVFDPTLVAALYSIGVIGGIAAVNTESVDYGVGTASVVITNSGTAQENFSLQVFASAISTTPVDNLYSDSNAQNMWGDVTYTIDVPLVQDKTYAQSYAQKLLGFVTDPARTFTGEIIGDPSIELMDIVTIHDDFDKIGSTDTVPLRFQWSFNGGLSCGIVNRKLIA